MDIRHGLEGVVVDTTAISLVDGQNGILSYRGVPVDDLIACDFGEVAELVIDGQLGSSLAGQLHEAGNLSARELDLVLALPAETHPMHVLQGMTPLLDAGRTFAYRADAAQGFTVAAKLPALLAAFQLGRAPEPSSTADPAVRFLEQINAPTTDIAIAAFRTTQILQLEHSFNASTFVARACASTLAPVENALSAAFGTLHGRLHGGADHGCVGR